MSKKKKDKITQLDVYKKVRKYWTRNPGLQLHKSKKRKSRQQKKIQFKKELNKGDY